MVEAITTSHQLARELLKRPDGFITMSINDSEYLISSIRRKNSCANYDDSSLYWILNGEYRSRGNIKR